MSGPKTIALKAVRDALMCAQIRAKVSPAAFDGKRMGRYAAFTQYPESFDFDCRRMRRTANMAPRMQFGPMSRGAIERVLQRTRCERGLPEVRRTWGVGMKALQAEIADGVLR